MRKLFLLLLLPFCIACSDSSRSKGTLNSNKISEEYIFDLRENIGFIGSISDITFIDESAFALASEKPNCVIIYDFEGKQKKIIKAGDGGKNEFKNPSVIKYFNDKLYVWCAVRHRFFIYDKEGNFLRVEKGPAYAIGNFVIKNGLAYCYLDGGQRSWLSIFSFDKNETIKYLGSAKDEQLILDRNAISAGMTLWESNVLAIPSNELNVYLFKDSFDITLTKEIEDDGFKVDSLKMDPYEMVNANFKQVIDYLQHNSHVNGLYPLGGKLIVKAETGIIERDERNILSNKNRFEKYYLLSEDLELMRTYKVPHNFYVEGLFFSSHTNLYRLYMVEGKESFIYKMYRMEFQ